MTEASPEELFVRGLWSGVIPSHDPSWVGRVAAQEPDERPLGDQSAIVRRMLDAGVTERDIARFARIVGYEVAFGCCYHLDDPAGADADLDDDVAWGLFRIDPETDEPREPMTGIYELLLGADPTGTEMRPPG